MVYFGYNFTLSYPSSLERNIKIINNNVRFIQDLGNFRTLYNIKYSTDEDTNTNMAKFD